MSVGRVIEAEAGVGWQPVLQHPNQPTGGQMPGNRMFVGTGQPYTLKRGVDDQLMAVEGERAVDVDDLLLATFFEFSTV